MGIRRWWPVLAVAALFAGPSTADAARPILPAQVSGTHFVVHYYPATASTEYATAGLADFEESYARLVAGGGGIPNAGLRAPVNDAPLGGDGRTDVYLMAPTSLPDFTGGLEVGDHRSFPDPLVDSGYLYMTPDLTRSGFRFRAAHEFMHVIQDAYLSTVGLLTESSANWAAEQGLADVDPGDNNFSVPWLPLDCTYGEWNGEKCGNGYRQWPFLQRLTERFGVGFMDRLWMRLRTECPCDVTTPALDRQLLEHAIAAEPGDETLGSMFADYAAALWNPKGWVTSAISTMYQYEVPAATDVTLTRDTPSSGVQPVVIDHLATRYLRLRLAGPAAAGDAVRLTVTRPGTPAAPIRVLSGVGSDQPRQIAVLPATAPGTYSGTVSLDVASVTDVVLPLVNDGITDGAGFTWQAELVPGGPPTPPAGDRRASPARIQPRTTTVVDNAYATDATDEPPACPTTLSATRGVWFVVLVDRGPLVIDPRGSDFEAAVAVFDISTGAPTLWACSKPGEGGLISADTYAREYLIYVGRARSATGLGHTLRLAIDGVPNSFGTEPEPLDVTAPSVGELRLTPARFRAAKRGAPFPSTAAKKTGSTVSFTLSEASDVRFGFQARVTGRKVGTSCVPTTSRNRSRKPCKRWAEIGKATVRGVKAGDVRMPFSGRRTAKRALRPGNYRLSAAATDVAGNSSSAVTRTFAIKR